MAELTSAQVDSAYSSGGSRRRFVIGAVVAAVVVAAGGVYLARPDAVFGPQAEAGEVLGDVLVGDGLKYGVSVKLPWGGLTVSADDPVDVIPSRASYSDRHDATYDEIEPPGGGAWLPVVVERDISGDDVLFRSRADVSVPATTVSLRSGDRVTPLAKSSGSSATPTAEQRRTEQLAPSREGYLALPDGTDRDELIVRVEFAGVRQEFDLKSGKMLTAGKAAPLYRGQATSVDARCGPASVPGYRLGFTVRGTCGINMLATVPYVAGLGWAQAGRTWLVVKGETQPPAQVFRASGSGSSKAYYADRDDEGRTARLRYGVTDPVATANFNAVNRSGGVDPDNPDQFVYDVPATDDGRRAPFTLTTTYRAHAGNSFPAGGSVTLTATRTIRP